MNIAIVGKMYSGKTTLANIFVEEHGYSRVNLAGPLKALAKFAYGDVQKDNEYETVGMNGSVSMKTGRRIFQEIGQSIKVVDRDIWLKCFINDTANMGKGPYVCDDVRFGFEADYLRDQGWYIVCVDTPEEVRVQRAMQINGKRPTEKELNHESEVEVSQIQGDFTLDGTFPIDMLSQTVDSILKFDE